MYYFTVNYSTIYYSTTTPAVCISETDLRRFTRILLFYYFTISVLFYHDPSRLHLGNRPAPVHPGFYCFTILLFQYCTILLCTILLLTILLFTILP